MQKGFTLIELTVVVVIIIILSGIIIFSVTKYIDSGKDSNVQGNLEVLIPAGETFYDVGNTYLHFCDPSDSVLENAYSQMPAPENGTGDCASQDPAGVCCNVSIDGLSWAACDEEFADTTKAYCVDSRGFREEICNKLCVPSLTQCPDPTQAGC